METEIINGREKPTLNVLRNLKKGQWIFTCSLQPCQFNSFDPNKKEENYQRNEFTDKEWERFSKYDDFTTIEGSSHSVYHCGLRTISEKYAKWFIKNECWKLWDDNCDSEDTYKNKVKNFCDKEGIEFEGV